MAKQANYEALEQGRKEPAKGAVERIAAGMQVPQQTDFLNLVLESLPHPFYVIDCLDYTIKLANSSAHKGLPAKGVTCYSLTHNSDRPCRSAKHPCPLEVVKKTKEPIIVEHIHYDEHGHPKNVEIHAAPIFNAQGNVSQIIECAMDVTERKRTEEALLQREEYFRSQHF